MSTAIGAWMLCGAEPGDCQAVHVQQVLYGSGRGPVTVTVGGGGDTVDDDRGSEW